MDSILEKSVPDTDAEGAKGYARISQAKGQNHHHRALSPFGDRRLAVFDCVRKLVGFRIFLLRILSFFAA